MSIFEKLKESIDFTKESIELAKKDKSLLVTPIASLITVPLVAVVFFLIFFFVFEYDFFSHIYLFLFFILLFFTLSFISTFLGAAHSWMTYEVYSKGETTFLRGIKKAFKEIVDVLLFSFASFFIYSFGSFLSRRKGYGGRFVGSVAADVVEAGWEVVGKFIIPAMIVKEQTFFQALRDVKLLVKNMPQSLVGAFAFDYIANILEYFVVVLSFTIGFFAFSISKNIFSSAIIGGTLFVLFSILIIIFKIFIKNTYFTVMYLKIKE